MKLFPQTLLDELTAKAGASPRLRANHNIHASPADPVQRFFTSPPARYYFRPHRHLTKSEARPRPARTLDILTFDADGAVTDAFELDRTQRTSGLKRRGPRGIRCWPSLMAPRSWRSEKDRTIRQPAAEFALVGAGRRP